MPADTIIRCPGCRAITDARLAYCPGCGRCLGCGDIRVKLPKDCPRCEVPYCECCGRCAACGEWRQEEVPTCSCGHPDEPSSVARLVEGESVHKPSGCMSVIVIG